MTKQQPFGSRLRLSKLCQWILFLASFKLTFLAALYFTDLELTPQQRVEEALAGPVAGTEAGVSARARLGSFIASALPARPAVTEAHAAEMPPVEPVIPPAPKIRPTQSPLAQERTMLEGGDPKAAPAAAGSGHLVPRDALQRKQDELNRREQELVSLQEQMQKRLDELKTLEQKIQEMLKQADTMQDEKLRHLIDVYSNMKAKQAAAVLSTLDEQIAVKILSGMRGKQAGEILTYMSPAPAAKLSELLSRTQLDL